MRRCNLKGKAARKICSALLMPFHIISTVLTFVILICFLFDIISAGAALMSLLCLLGVVGYHQYWQYINTRHISDHFASYPVAFANYRVIAQYQQGTYANCREALQEISKEQHTLVSKIQQGRYKAITHETVLRRIERDERLHIVSCTPIAKDNLQDTLRRMTGGKECHNCKEKKNCRYMPMVQANRQFYIIAYNKTIERTL